MYVILRHEKHHSLGTIGAAASHTMRTRDTPNADPGGPPPEVWIGTSKPASDVAGVLPTKRRKNAVLALEYLVTASPEFFEGRPEKEWRRYLHDQVGMLQAYYGEANVRSVVLHQDEKTPHLAVMVVPLLDGKLNARAYVGGREACRVLQDLAGDVGQPHGLSRGKQGSTAEHQAVREWYADLAPRAADARQTIEAAKVQAEQIAQEANELAAMKARLVEAAEEVQAMRKANQTERERLAQLSEAMTPEQQYQAAERLEQIQQAAKRPGKQVDEQPSAAPSGRPGRRPGPAGGRP